ncbi:tetratricopeptide repeat protein [Alkalilimnicola sp. S0819]|uniref:tetratricopeptide repeat protein n=1 Tax=Alkalilimnicola sp. S0819 TaxID=2613922 RepID=UPI0012623468|nr:tetratricopeptide repeat protein [Alkalilimnicola sp. S0819]KAB7622639.1 hypothetical protein F3N43_12275 [Alkalilimnicola sp. S0819]MPQ17410.1 hypothetical protein [Alkalilimnicola sp. S0819]
MSLINDVLRDLERRQRGQSDALAGLRPVQHRSGGARRTLWALLILLLLAAVTGGGWWLWTTAPGAGQQSAAAPEGTATPVVPSAITPAAADGASAIEESRSDPGASRPRAPRQAPAPAPAPRLHTLNARREGEWLRLGLHTDRLLPHRISRGERSLELLLPGAELAAALPDIAALDGRLQTVDLRQGEQGVQLAMSFNEPVRVQAGWERGQDGARLALDIHLPTPAPTPSPRGEPKDAPVATATVLPRHGAPTQGTSTEPTAAARPQASTQQAPHAARATPSGGAAAGGDAAASQARFSKQAAAPTPERRARALLREGDKLLGARRPGAAAGAYREALDWRPGLEAARRGLVDALLRAGREAQAMDELRAALARPALSAAAEADFAARLARLLAARGDTERAVAVLQEHAPARLGDGEYHALLAALLQRGGNYAESARWYQRVLEVDPQRAVWWMGLGLALEGAASYTSAAQAYGAALQADGLGAEAEQFVRERLRALQ